MCAMRYCVRRVYNSDMLRSFRRRMTIEKFISFANMKFVGSLQTTCVIIRTCVSSSQTLLIILNSSLVYTSESVGMSQMHLI